MWEEGQGTAGLTVVVRVDGDVAADLVAGLGVADDYRRDRLPGLVILQRPHAPISHDRSIDRPTDRPRRLGLTSRRPVPNPPRMVSHAAWSHGTVSNTHLPCLPDATDRNDETKRTTDAR